MYSVEDGMDGDFLAVAAGFDPADDEDADGFEDEDDVLPVTLPPLYMTEPLADTYIVALEIVPSLDLIYAASVF